MRFVADHFGPVVVNALTNFANLTLSSLYFDITKDCLYAEERYGKERRAILTVLEQVSVVPSSLDNCLKEIRQVLKTMTFVMAPILPHLAEEIHHHLGVSERGETPVSSVFTNYWEPLVRSIHGFSYGAKLMVWSGPSLVRFPSGKGHG